jgi:hypothetical protein
MHLAILPGIHYRAANFGAQNFISPRNRESMQRRLLRVDERMEMPCGKEVEQQCKPYGFVKTMPPRRTHPTRSA